MTTASERVARRRRQIECAQIVVESWPEAKRTEMMAGLTRASAEAEFIRTYVRPS
jgi:hypothetical protein